jgi:hypothetical protein
MKTISLKAIEEAFKTLKYKSPIISVDGNYLTIQVNTGWLIINKKDFYEKIYSKIHY